MHITELGLDNFVLLQTADAKYERATDDLQSCISTVAIPR